ncbi:hypothetical protein BU26DRAFT_609273 [Trematosphaeria pertusa]|uniref:Uncharacterized protein n=1 Tax=Trematosphaeria pertusa TaxID=390896 RepID=A0A6A6HZN6_9PLEO|nr:uncharacterized protein BU26DRAFT_609273 [Trematosphaeria pertusa]KAF2243182.1 hypothetical protein BU26DRAFT_609273 [Trematosphaeria pertusa]
MFAPSFARTNMAEAADYNPRKHGLITLAPDTDEVDFGDEAQPLNAKDHSANPSGGGLFGFAFAINDSFAPKFGGGAGSDGLTPAGPAPTERRNPAKLQKKRPAGDDGVSYSTILGLKRKPSDHDINPNTRTAPTTYKDASDHNKKRRVGDYNYVFTSNPDSITQSDPNTNANSDLQLRRPKKYAWGTSKVRRGYRSLKISLTDKITSFWGASKSSNAPTNELSFDEKTFMVDYPPLRDIDMGEA